MRVFVDTNVCLELLLKREKYEKVSYFFQLAIMNRHHTYMSSMSLRDIGYVVHKYTHDKDRSRKMQVLAYQMVTKITSISSDAAIESLYSDIVDYEDSLQSYAAEEAMCDTIITYNKKDFVGSNLPIYTPEEMCVIWERLNQEKNIEQK